jgi:NADH:ubiquinone oxidoreductase subunit 3 (subunit A)
MIEVVILLNILHLLILHFEVRNVGYKLSWQTNLNAHIVEEMTLYRYGSGTHAKGKSRRQLGLSFYSCPNQLVLCYILEREADFDV